MPITVRWQPYQGDDLSPAGGGVDLWRAPATSAAAGADAQAILATEELERAWRIRVAAKRDQAIATRAAARRILAKYLGLPPRDVAIGYAPHGKPQLPTTASPRWEFNISHAGEWALVGVTWGRPLGVDLEQIRPLHSPECFASSVLTPSELAELANCPTAAASEQYLFHRWTFKEAALKGAGCGLSVALDGVAVVNGGPARLGELCALLPPAAGGGRWSLSAVPFEDDYCAAVALPWEDAESTPIRWRLFDLASAD